MKKSLISIGLVSFLSLTVLCGAIVLANDNANTVPAPPPSLKNKAAASTPNNGASEARQKLLISKSEASGDSPESITDSNSAEQAANTVVISGGFNTDPQDKGRPVVLIAAALGVPTEVFREAFSGVTPAGLDRGPTAEEAQRNKAALLKVLSPYGITNKQLDEVSDYYRYNGSKGGTWPRVQATATVIVKDGVVTGVEITNPGAGYTSNPTITVIGPSGKITATASLSYTKDFKTNGSITAIKIK